MPTPTQRVSYTKLPAQQGSLDTSQLRPVYTRLPDYIRLLPVYANGHPFRDPGVPDPRLALDSFESYKRTAHDWNIERTYSTTLFDTPELGKIEYSTTVQYNTLTSLDWHYTPKQRTSVVAQPRPRIEPFARMTYNTFGQYTVGGGAYLRGVGIEGFYQHNPFLGTKGWGVGVSYKF